MSKVFTNDQFNKESKNVLKNTPLKVVKVTENYYGGGVLCVLRPYFTNPFFEDCNTNTDYQISLAVKKITDPKTKRKYDVLLSGEEVLVYEILHEIYIKELEDIAVLLIKYFINNEGAA